MTMSMKLAVVFNGQVFDVDLDDDLVNYDLEKPMPRAVVCHEIARAIERAKREG